MFDLRPINPLKKRMPLDFLDPLGPESLTKFHIEQPLDEFPRLRRDHPLAIPNLRPLNPKTEYIIEHLLNRLRPKGLLPNQHLIHNHPQTPPINRLVIRGHSLQNLRGDVIRRTDYFGFLFWVVKEGLSAAFAEGGGGTGRGVRQGAQGGGVV